MLSVVGCSVVDPLAPSVLYSDTEDKTLLSSTTSSSDLSPSTSSSSASRSSSRAQSPIKQSSSTSNEDINRNASDSGSRPDTPPTPASISTSAFTKVNNNFNNYSISPQKPKHFTSQQDNFLQLIEPFPVLPPQYSTLPPGGCPRFPISLRPHSSDEKLPNYTPSVYKLGIVSRKLEWLTPYEPSPARSWKSVIMELNSTQLSFYAVPSTLENHLLAFRPVTLHDGDRTHNEFAPEELRNVESQHTTEGDLQFYRMCQRLNLIGSSAEDGKKNNSNKKLIRSYSLQHARVGLATDYKKRPNVLRLRIESEQILVYFPTTKVLIEWNMAIGIGKDIALDLNERELPRYRTVPRRRRRDRSEEAANYEAQCQALIQQSKQYASQNNQNSSRGFRLRSSSDPNSRFRDKLSKLKSKLSVSSTQSSTSQASAASASRNFIDPTGFSGTQSHAVFSSDNPRFPNLEIVRSNSSPNFALFNESEYEDESAVNSTYEYDEDDYDEEMYEVMTSSRNQASSSRTATRAPQRIPGHTTAIVSVGASSRPGSFSSTVIKTANEVGYQIDCGEDEDDIQNLSDLHQTDEEDEYEEDVVDDCVDDEAGVPSTSSQNRKTNRRTSTSPQKPKNSNSTRRSFEDQKWQPPLEKVQSKRKYYRNCLRCIKPLTMEDSWTSKSLVKPTTLSPLNFAYLKNIKYNGELSISSSATSLISLNSTVSSQNSTNESTSGFRKNRSFSFKEINGFNLPDSALTKVTNHFLKEYVVGAHGLIPKNV